MIAAIYARKSTDDSDRNAETRSTQRQIDSARRRTRRPKGWTVDPRYIFVDENTSGTEWKHRPGFNPLLAGLEPRPPFDVVIVSELSHIGRDTVRTPAAVLRIEEAADRDPLVSERCAHQSGRRSGRAAHDLQLHARQLRASASAGAHLLDALRKRAEAGAVELPRFGGR